VEGEAVASLAKDRSGWRTLLVHPTTSKRVTIRYGQCAAKNAQTAHNMVERLAEAKVLGTPMDGPTAEWLKRIDGKLRDRLVAVGLVEARKTARLGDFRTEYIETRRQRGDVTDSTIEVWGHTKRNLIAFFGEDRDIRTITAKDADDWAAWLKTSEKLGENTIRKRSQFAKRFFRVAVKRKLIAEDPFASLVGTVVSVPERKFFIPRETVNALLNQCRGPEYRLLLVFARYMGVRIPSEIVPLTWGDVDWEGQRIVISSPKTKRHKGGDKRVCPIFPEILPFLREAWEAAPEGATWIFPSIRSKGKNLRTWLERAILKAGFTPWPRLWQNFRATRATELADAYPSHVAAVWLGHTERIADRHYRQVTGEHFSRATSEPTGVLPSFGAGAEEVGTYLAHSPHVMAYQRGSRKQESPGKSEDCGALNRGDSPPSGGQGTRTLNRQAGT
jgi:integrase